MKFIREVRMGPPKSYKTGAVAGTYPKPMLYLGFDRGGIDVIPPKSMVIPPGLVVPDVRYEEVEKIKPGIIGTWLAKPESEQPKILAVEYAQSDVMSMSLDMAPIKNQKPLQDFVNDYNAIAGFINSGKPFPWKTVMLDSITGYEDAIMSYISSFNPSAFSDARQWAAQVGGKVRQTILTLTTWPCHIVVLMHSIVDKNELTGVVKEGPNVFSPGLRADIFGLFSQAFYATKTSMNVPVVWTDTKMYVSGIGSRWPIGLPPECAPDFKTLYGKEGI
jgi:hypothetical protein